MNVSVGTPDPILAPVVLGPAELTRSSARLRWHGVLVEKHACSPGERAADRPLDRPVLVMLCSPSWRGERKASDGKFVPVHKTLGALTVAPKGPVAVMRSTQASDILYCAFDEFVLSELRDDLEGPLPLPLDLRTGLYDDAVSEILNLLLAEIESGGESGALYAESLAQALMVRFLFLGQQTPPPWAKTSRLAQRKFFHLQDMIETRLEADLTLRELAAEVGYSRSQFLRVFHATTGMTPHQYILKRRIERARHLLKHTDINIADITYTCGFSSQAHLTLAFKREYGVTPAEYRRHV
jgi:AraC family transcriptional regulator